MDVEVQIGDTPDMADNDLPARESTAMEGVQLSDIPTDHEAYGNISGVLVTSVEQGSRAYRNGLQAGDIITAINRQPVDSRNAFMTFLESHSGTIALNVTRGDQLLFLIIR